MKKRELIERNCEIMKQKQKKINPEIGFFEKNTNPRVFIESNIVLIKYTIFTKNIEL